MFKAFKKIFKRGGKKEKKEDKKRLLENEEERTMVMDDLIEEGVEQIPIHTEECVQNRFIEDLDLCGNAFLIVKPPAVWYPGEHTEEYGWSEDSNYTSLKFHRIWNWIDTKDVGWYPYEDKEEYDGMFLEDRKKDPKPSLSVNRKEPLNKEMTEMWLEETSRVKFPVVHYEMDRFEKEWLDYEDYEWAVPEDAVRGLGLPDEEESDEAEWNSVMY